MDPPWIHAILFFFAPVNDIMHSESEIKCLQPYGEEESLRGTRPEELLPLVGVARREGDWVDGELELCRDGARPLGELGGRKEEETLALRKIFVVIFQSKVRENLSKTPTA